MNDWIVAILMTMVISVVYLIIDRYYTDKRYEKRYRNEKRISEATTVDELIDLRTEIKDPELINIIDRKLDRLTS